MARVEGLEVKAREAEVRAPVVPVGLVAL
jgi:hypothetical protein